jgi:Creatinase/Prolidase N-terminal domain
MRRGLMGWSETDLPEAALRQRLSRLQAGLKAAGFGGVVLYTNHARPAAVSFLTGFTPYWSEGLLFVPASGEPVLAVALSKRVAGWIRSVMPVGEIENTPEPAAAIGRGLADAGIRKLGVVELDMFPGAQAGRLTRSDSAVSLEDASALFRSVRVGVDAAEIAFARRADALARDCLACDGREMFYGGGDDARRMVADIEARARRAGAEEVFVGVAPDLASRANAFLRSDRLGALGEHFAIRLSLAVKGSWIRRTITVSRNPETQATVAAANTAFERALALASAPIALKALEAGFPGRITGWTIEACVGSYPLETVACSGDGRTISDILPVSIISVQAEVNRITWLGAAPVIGEAQS